MEASSLKSAAFVTIGATLLGSVSVFLDKADYIGAIIAAVVGFGILAAKYKLGF